MRIAIISDIHGNLEAFTTVLQDTQSQQADRIVSLGDNIAYGADSEKVIQLLISRNIPSVLGNHEMAALNEKVLNWHTGEVRKAIEFAIASLSEKSFQYIRESARAFSDSGSYFVHGFPPDSFRLYLNQIGDAQLIKALIEMKESICFVGHTHNLKLLYYEKNELFNQRINKEPLKIQKDKKYIMNVGSVGQARDGSAQAKYVIWDSGKSQIEIRTIEYDSAAAARKIIAAGIPSRFADMIQRK